jgi:hypothetical protein
MPTHVQHICASLLLAQNMAAWVVMELRTSPGGDGHSG